MTDLPPLLCAECGNPIEPIRTAVALRFTVVNDQANWGQRYEHRPLTGAFHGGCAEAAFRRNAERFNAPDPWERLGRWLANREHGPGRSWRHYARAYQRFVELSESVGPGRGNSALGEGPTLETALVDALEKVHA